jgi:hypothetical protein
VEFGDVEIFLVSKVHILHMPTWRWDTYRDSAGSESWCPDGGAKTWIVAIAADSVPLQSTKKVVCTENCSVCQCEGDQMPHRIWEFGGRIVPHFPHRFGKICTNMKFGGNVNDEYEGWTSMWSFLFMGLWSIHFFLSVIFMSFIHLCR